MSEDTQHMTRAELFAMLRVATRERMFAYEHREDWDGARTLAATLAVALAPSAARGDTIDLIGRLRKGDEKWTPE